MIFITEADDIGKRIDNLVAERCDMSRSAIQKLIRDGMVKVQGETVSKSFIAKNGQSVQVIIPEPASLNVEAENIPLDIIYEDSDLLVVNKKKGMVVHPAPGNESHTLVNALLYHCKESLSGINGVMRPGIVHRIDKNTGGLLVVAKNDKSHIKLAKQISEHTFARRYEAVCVGRMKQDRGRIEKNIGRHPVIRNKMAVLSQGGRFAVTNWTLIENFEGFAHISCALETGRTHQIRVHMAYIGHPLLCDDVYGSVSTKFEKQNMDLVQGQCLHAKSIGFVHPSTGEEMYFESPLPEYFVQILDKLRKMNGER